MCDDVAMHVVAHDSDDDSPSLFLCCGIGLPRCEGMLHMIRSTASVCCVLCAFCLVVFWSVVCDWRSCSRTVLGEWTLSHDAEMRLCEHGAKHWCGHPMDKQNWPASLVAVLLDHSAVLLTRVLYHWISPRCVLTYPRLAAD